MIWTPFTEHWDPLRGTRVTVPPTFSKMQCSLSKSRPWRTEKGKQRKKICPLVSGAMIPNLHLFSQFELWGEHLCLVRKLNFRSSQHQLTESALTCHSVGLDITRNKGLHLQEKNSWVTWLSWLPLRRSAWVWMNFLLQLPKGPTKMEGADGPGVPGLTVTSTLTDAAFLEHKPKVKDECGRAWILGGPRSLQKSWGELDLHRALRACGCQGLPAPTQPPSWWYMARQRHEHRSHKPTQFQAQFLATCSEAQTKLLPLCSPDLHCEQNFSVYRKHVCWALSITYNKPNQDQHIT